MSSHPPATVLASLDHHARTDPSRQCIVDLTAAGEFREWSYGQVREAAGRLGCRFAEMGVRRGDRIALRLSNSWEFVIALLGAWRAGAIVVPTIRQYAVAELRHAIVDSGAAILVADDDGGSDVRAAVSDTTVTVVTTRSAWGDHLFAELVRKPATPPDLVLHADDDALIFYTSGTTSAPKGVVLTHGNVGAASLTNASSWQLRSDDRGLVVLPMFHCNALLMQMLPTLLVGGTSVLTGSFSASRYLDTVRDHRITHANLTAAAIRSVLAQEPRENDRDHEVRLLTFGLPLDRTEIETVAARFGMSAFMAYGLTESSTGGTRSPVHVDARPGWQSLGLAQPGWKVRIVEESGRDAGAGVEGEILLQGPGVMDRYWNRPEETDAALNGGWLHTGDIGFLDDDGYLYFHSRKKDMLKPKGENVAASEIELVLDACGGVLESAVVGVPDPFREERIIAFVVPSADADLDVSALRAHCEERLARFKVPSDFRLVDSLLKTSIGKVNKGALRQLAESSRRVEVGEDGTVG